MDALDDLKVIELSESVPGAYCAKLLADFGAEVIKIEKLGSGDETRRIGPFPGDLPNPEGSGMFLFLNTNKLGITLNPFLPLGRKIFEELCEKADILVLSMAPAEAEKLDYEALTQVNPRLILVVITPFGLTGTYKDYTANELVLMHMSSVAYFTPGNVENPEQEPPLKLTGRQTELTAGMSGAIAAMVAIAHRETTGLGQVVDVASRDAPMLSNIWNLGALSYTGVQPTRAVGKTHSAPGHLLPCKDGHIQLSCNEEAHWKRFLEVIGIPEWSKAEVFKDRYSRGEHWEALRPLLIDVLKDWEKETISREAQARGVPCTMVASPAELQPNYLTIITLPKEVSLPRLSIQSLVQ